MFNTFVFSVRFSVFRKVALHKFTGAVLKSPVKCVTMASAATRATSTRGLSSEVDKSRAGRPPAHQLTIFERIIAGEIKADVTFQDERCLAFNDVNPQAPTHFLVIPKRRIPMLDDAVDEDRDLLGHLLLVAKTLAKERLPGGYRLVINNGVHGSQSVYYLHIHVLGGRQMGWPPG